MEITLEYYYEVGFNDFKTHNFLSHVRHNNTIFKIQSNVVHPNVNYTKQQGKLLVSVKPLPSISLLNNIKN